MTVSDTSDFLCEKRLRATDEDLYRRYRNSVFAIDRLLANYKNIFPFFTDHTFEHSEQVINYCNIVAGQEIIETLNADEIYILLMGAALHDVGMGISEADFQEMKDGIPEILEYTRKHPNELTAEYTRLFHHKLSAAFVKKYSRLFEIPSDEYVYCISKVASGHRDADLLDEYGFPSAMRLANGSTVNLAYLTALVKLADELDVTSDRNLMFDYSKVNEEWSEHQTMCYKCHGAIKRLCLTGDSLVLYYATDEPEVEKEILRTKGKVEHTFSQYAAVVENRTAFRNTIKQVTFTRIKN